MLQKARNQAYKLELPVELAGIHNTFHVCYIISFLGEDPYMIPLLELRVNENQRLIEEPDGIVHREMKKLRCKMVELVLVRWKHTNGPTLTWETTRDMRSRYPPLFVDA